MSFNKNAQLLKEKFNLQKHPEGGFFVRIYKSKHEVIIKSQAQDNKRSAGSSIYYLLENEEFSAWHSLSSDEIWHFYSGSAIRIYVINKNGDLISHLLGNPLVDNDASFQIIIKAGEWFCAEVVDKHSYGLVGCTVSPGFEYQDFQLAKAEKLIALFPQHETIIKKFARNSSQELSLDSKLIPKHS